MSEFGWIERYFAPLAEGFPGSLNLKDDAALLDVPVGKQLVLTKDAMSAGIHFIGDEDAKLIARKLLRTNLSDLAAMGATPLGYMLAVMLPKETPESWVARFAEGLAQDQAEYGIHLIGGDTIATNGALGFSLTASGLVENGHALKRSGASEGDLIYTSGTLGDAALGLASLQQKRGDIFLEDRYLLPQPRVELGQKLVGVANAAMDISDGLVQDLGHICKASGVGAEIYRHLLPLSDAANAQGAAAYDAALSGGDDYELLFTITPSRKPLMIELAGELGLKLTQIGRIIAGQRVVVLDEKHKEVAVKSEGFQHF